MGHAVVEFAKSDTGVSMRLFKASLPRAGMLDYTALTLDPKELPSLKLRADVTSYGHRLRQALAAHAAIDDELTDMFATQPGDEVSLRLVFGVDEAEAFRWETLCATDKFLALAGAAAVGRVPLSGTDSGPPLRLLDGPIRLAAFLSAAGKITARPEFQAIAEAVKEANAAELAVEATIFLGEEELLEDAEKQIGDGTLKHVTVLPMPGGALELEASIKQVRPQLLHFFCHGRVEAGTQLLEMATISEKDDPSVTRGTAILSIDRLTKVLVDIGSVWTTVLNCCNGGLQVPGLSSMAAALVKSTGSPMAVGMAEEIADTDATLFTGAFYAEAFAGLAGIATADEGERFEVEFSRAVGRGRSVLHARHEFGEVDCFGHWCLPLFYRCFEPLRVTRVGSPAMAERIKMIAATLRGLPDSTPRTVRRDIRRLLAQEPAIPEELWPDYDGVFR